MTLTARLAAARWACLGAQARLDRLEAQRKNQPTEAHSVWLEICDLRRAYYDSEAARS